MSSLFKLLLNGLSVLVAAGLINLFVPAISPIQIASYPAAILASLLLSVMNRTVKPLLKLITLPINIVTLGLFGFVINGIIILLLPSLVEFFIPGGFVIRGGLWWAVVFGAVMSFVQSTLHVLVK